MVSLDINGKNWRNDYFQLHPPSGKISYRYQRHLLIIFKNNRGIVYFLQGNNERGCPDAKKACELGVCKVLEIVKPGLRNRDFVKHLYCHFEESRRVGTTRNLNVSKLLKISPQQSWTIAFGRNGKKRFAKG